MQHATKHRPANWWWADAISWTRLAIVIAFLPTFWEALSTDNQASRGWSALVLTFTFRTDWVDGFVARKFRITSNFGAMLDTSVDKVAVVIPMVMLGINGNIAPNYIIGWVLFSLTTQREVMMFFGRPIIKKKWDIQLHVQPIGKFKMALQCAAIVAAFWPPTDGEISAGLFWAATGCAIASQYDYWHTLRRELTSRQLAHATA